MKQFVVWKSDQSNRRIEYWSWERLDGLAEGGFYPTEAAATARAQASLAERPFDAELAKTFKPRSAP